MESVKDGSRCVVSYRRLSPLRSQRICKSQCRVLTGHDGCLYCRHLSGIRARKLLEHGDDARQFVCLDSAGPVALGAVSSDGGVTVTAPVIDAVLCGHAGKELVKLRDDRCSIADSGRHALGGIMPHVSGTKYATDTGFMLSSLCGNVGSR